MSIPCKKESEIEFLKKETNKQEMNITLLANDIIYMKETMKSIENKLDKFIDSADQKFANKRCERILILVWTITITWLVGALLTLLLKN